MPRKQTVTATPCTWNSPGRSYSRKSPLARKEKRRQNDPDGIRPRDAQGKAGQRVSTRVTGAEPGDPVEAIGSEGCLHSQLLRRGTSHLEDDGLKFSHSHGDGKLQREALTGGLFVSALKVSISQKSLPGRGQGCP